MNGDVAPVNTAVVARVLAAGLAISVLVWAWLAAEKLRGRAWVPFQRRRPVPWDALLVGTVIVVYLLGGPLTLLLAKTWEAYAAPVAIEDKDARPAAESADTADVAPSDAAAPGADDSARPRRPGSDHVLVILLREYPSGWVIALCALSAIVVAPIWEEIFFRLVLLGWLERVETNLARWVRIPARLRGVGPVVLGALAFALPHIRLSSSQLPASRLLTLTAVHTGVTVAMTLVVLVMLRRGAGATPIDLGWDRRRWLGDAVRGVVAFGAIMVPLYFLQAGLKLFLESRGLGWLAPDPAPIFFLALVLGYLYYRTHRLAAPIALHMALNATTLGLFFLQKP